jgi:hypothetical protein
MKRLIVAALLPRFCGAIFILIIAFAGSCFAEQVKFGDWVCIAETKTATDAQSRRIGTTAKDGISSLWVSESGAGDGTVQLTLKSKRVIESEYFAYRIDKDTGITLSSASRACESYCLTTLVLKNDDLIQMMKKGLRIYFEYYSLSDTAHQPTFSLTGFTKAYNWLLQK